MVRELEAKRPKPRSQEEFVMERFVDTAGVLAPKHSRTASFVQTLYDILQ